MRQHVRTAAQDLDALALAGTSARPTTDTLGAILPCAPLDSSPADIMATSAVNKCELTYVCSLPRAAPVSPGVAHLLRLLRAVLRTLGGFMPAVALLTACVVTHL